MPKTDLLNWIQNFCPDYAISDPIYENCDKNPMTSIYPLDKADADLHYVVKYVCHHCDQDESNQINKQIADQLKIASSLSGCDGIVKLHGHDERYKDGCYELLLLMDHLTSLQDIIMMGADMDNESVIGMALDVLEGLTECHKRKLAHRDIKPENIFRNKEGRYELGDFDISAYLQENNDMPFDERRERCTTFYAAPEVLNREKVIDWMRTDVFSLCLVLYYLMNNGELPWGKNGQKEIDERRREYADISLPDVPLHLFAVACVIRKGLSFDPQKRYASAVELLEDMKLAIADDPKCFARNEYLHTLVQRKKGYIWPALIGAGLCAVLLIGAWLVFGRTVPNISGQTQMITEAVTEKMYLTQIPQYGSSDPFCGYIDSDQPADYRVTLYLRVSDNTEYYVKPTLEQSYVSVESDGTFSIDYVSGTNDENAVDLYIFLIPDDFRPTNNIESTKRNALYGIHILRNSDGSMETEYMIET